MIKHRSCRFINDIWMNVSYSYMTQNISINKTTNFMGGKVGGNRSNTTFTFTITITNTRFRTNQSTIWIILNELLCQVWWCTIILRQNKPPIIPVSFKNNFLEGEVGCPRTNTTSTITRNHYQILTTTRQHKITTNKPKIIFMWRKLSGPMTNTAFNRNSCNTKWKTTRSTNRIITTPQYIPGGFCALTMRCLKPPIFTVFTKNVTPPQYLINRITCCCMNDSCMNVPYSDMTQNHHNKFSNKFSGR